MPKSILHLIVANTEKPEQLMRFSEEDGEESNRELSKEELLKCNKKNDEKSQVRIIAPTEKLQDLNVVRAFRGHGKDAFNQMKKEIKALLSENLG